MKQLIVLISLLFSTNVFADIETDKHAGTCSAYLVLSKNQNGASAAMNMSDNQQRATQFGITWMNKLKRYNNNQTMVKG